MPRQNKKAQIIKFLIDNALDEISLMIDIDLMWALLDEDYVDIISDELDEDIFVVLACRRGVETAVPKSLHWSHDILTQLDEDRFMQMLRVNRQQFQLIVNLISNDTVFNRAHSCEQFPIPLQLAIILYRLGSSGEGASLRRIAATFGVGDGGTIAKITVRVFRALLNLRTKYIFWPDEAERAAIVAATFDELPFCIGYIDGTEIPLAEAPVLAPVSFFSRKHQYSIKAQVVCDYKLRIRNVVGSPGSAHDAKIFSNCRLNKESTRFFSSQQWLAADSAYALSNTVITPYRNNSIQMNKEKRKAFNLRHSRYRVRVEHTFGFLQEKFCSLKQLKMRLNSKESHTFCCKWLIVCCILHNILVYESSVEIPEVDSVNTETGESEDNIPEYDTQGKERFEIKRQALYSLIFE